MVASLVTTTRAHADSGFAFHAEGAAARMVGPRKVDQFGWGGGGWVSPELTVGPYVGFELPIGAVALQEGDLSEIGLPDTGDGYVVFAFPGVRLRPFGRNASTSLLQPSGLWIGAGAGVAYTGDLVRPGVQARVGYDLTRDALRIGPYGGLLQIIETASVVRPEDARIIVFGIHAAYDPPPQRSPALPAAVDGDRDRDGYPNDSDGCPDQAEDFDDFEDENGCPDPDNDGDGILDKPDKCPLQAEDIDQFQDEDGCPDPDNDGDHILDKPDKCPLQAEDVDQFEDEDGCPDLDNDNDGIPDLQDKCPNDPETVNGYADDDGCPDEDQVRVLGDEIVLDDRIYFRVNMADIQVRSWSLMEKIAKLLQANPQYALIRIQGHADERGDADYNQQLSIRRGQAVRDMLSRFGVDRKRLVAEGFGESRPSVEGQTEQARRRNRRVEFLILKRVNAGTPVQSSAPREDVYGE